VLGASFWDDGIPRDRRSFAVVGRIDTFLQYVDVYLTYTTVKPNGPADFHNRTIAALIIPDNQAHEFTSHVAVQKCGFFRPSDTLKKVVAQTSISDSTFEQGFPEAGERMLREAVHVPQPQYALTPAALSVAAFIQAGKYRHAIHVITKAMIPAMAATGRTTPGWLWGSLPLMTEGRRRKLFHVCDESGWMRFKRT
jgi:hypothetical protein